MKIKPLVGSTFLGGRGGGKWDEPKADQKIVIRSRVLCNNYLQGILGALRDDTKNGCVADYISTGGTTTQHTHTRARAWWVIT